MTSSQLSAISFQFGAWLVCGLPRFGLVGERAESIGMRVRCGFGKRSDFQGTFSANLLLLQVDRFAFAGFYAKIVRSHPDNLLGMTRNFQTFGAEFGIFCALGGAVKR